MNGSMIDFSSHGQNYEGYMSQAKGGGPGVIVIQEWWGLVGHIMELCDRLADDGFTALAPDLYQGKIADEPDEAGKMMMALKIEEAEKIIDAAVTRLLVDPACSTTKAGIVGFCMGGQLALYAASVNPAIAACADFYGIHPNVHPKFDTMKCPLLGIFAEYDDYAPPASVTALGTTLDQHVIRHEFVTYPGTHHAFVNPSNAHHDSAAAEDAWNRLTAFFRQHLTA